MVVSEVVLTPYIWLFPFHRSAAGIQTSGRETHASQGGTVGKLTPQACVHVPYVIHVLVNT